MPQNASSNVRDLRLMTQKKCNIGFVDAFLLTMLSNYFILNTLFLLWIQGRHINQATLLYSAL